MLRREGEVFRLGTAMDRLAGVKMTAAADRPPL
jgi:hypothetical protein